MLLCFCVFFFFSSRRRHTRCALVTGVQTCALPISAVRIDDAPLIAVDGATRRASLAVGQARIERFCAVHREGFAHAEQIGLQVRRDDFAALIAEETEADDGVDIDAARDRRMTRSAEHTSELQSLMHISYAVFCLKKKKTLR